MHSTKPTALQQQAVSMQQTQEIPLNFALPRLYKIKKVVTLYTFLILFGVSLQRNSIFFKHFTEVLKVLILY